MEIVEGETLFTCNNCDEGFDFVCEVNKHILNTHEDIMKDILLKRVINDGEGNNKETKKYEFELEVEET